MGSSIQSSICTSITVSQYQSITVSQRLQSLGIKEMGYQIVPQVCVQLLQRSPLSNAAVTPLCTSTMATRLSVQRALNVMLLLLMLVRVIPADLQREGMMDMRNKLQLR